MAKSDPVTLPTVSLAERLRELAGVVLFGFAAFLMIAIASFITKDPGATVSRGGNLCGDAGYFLARTALFWFGNAAYLGVVIFFIWSLGLLARRPLVVGPFRLLWFGLFLFSSAALISHSSSSSALGVPDRGGLVGFQIVRIFEGALSFGPWGTKLVLFFLVLVTFMLATDMVLYVAAVAAIAFLKRRKIEAGALWQRTGPMFRSILAASEEGATERRSAPRKKRAKQPVEIGVTDDEVESPDLSDGDDAADDSTVSTATQKKTRKTRKSDVRAVIEAAEAAANEAEAAAAEEASLDRVDAQVIDDASEADVDLVDVDPGDEADSDDDAWDDGDAGDGAGNRLSADGKPAMLDDLPEAEVVPEPEPARKRQAKIRLEPPRTSAHRSAGFSTDTTHFEAPTSGEGTPRASDYRYVFPSPDLLETPTPVSSKEFQKMIEGNIEVLESALASYKIEAEVDEIQKGPVITMFELNVAPGTRVDRIRALEDDLAIRMKAPSVRIVAPIPGKSTIGIEIPNQIRETVCLRELVEAPEYDSANYAVPVFLGKDAAGRALIEDLARMPHLLVAGSTGSGKSVCLNAIIMSILFTRSPDQVQLILIDPKMVELSLYENIPHLMCPVVRDMNRAAQILEWACTKMDERYEILSEVGARNIFSYNKIPEAEKREKLNVDPDDDTFEAKMPFIIIVVDELADLMMVSAKEVENYITRLAQKSRAVGIHIILATQRPSTNVITGLIKANMPTRISFQVASKVDARVVLDQNGAEKLLGFGDMLYLPPRSSSLARGQGAFVADEEIKAVVDAIRVETPLYSRELMQKNKRLEMDPREVDDLYEEAALFVCESRRGSASLLQRKFAIGYTRASRLIDLMANDGILGEYRNAQAREVLVSIDEYLERSAGE